MVPVIQTDQKDAESDQGRQNPNEVAAHLSLLVRYMQPARQAAPMKTPRAFSWKTPTAMERQAAALELLAERMPALKGQERAVEASGDWNQGEGRPGNEHALETPWWRLWLRRLIG